MYIKEHNQFATMIIQTVTTATDKELEKTEGGMPKDAEQTLNGRFSNVCEKVSTAAKTYRADAWKKIEQEFQNQFAAFERSQPVKKKKTFADRFSDTKKFLVEKMITKGKFWIGLGIFLLLMTAFVTRGLDEVIKIVQILWK